MKLFKQGGANDVKKYFWMVGLIYEPPTRQENGQWSGANQGTSDG
jgi:hypothetical protein